MGFPVAARTGESANGTSSVFGIAAFDGNLGAVSNGLIYLTLKTCQEANQIGIA
jgi:hypothetical protein